MKVFFSRIFPLIPVTEPVSSTTTTCIPSPLPLLSVTYLLETGLGAISFQKIVALESPNVCPSYQSVTVPAAPANTPNPLPVLIPELFTGIIVDPDWKDLNGSD